MSGLRAQRSEGVLRLTLDRPESLNALDGALLLELSRALREAARDRETRVVLLSGAGRAFSSGADLEEVSRLSAAGAFEHGEHLRARFHPVVSGLRSLDKPVVAAVRGAAAGAGAALALACDLVVCSEGASFRLAFGRVGLLPDSGLTWLLPRRLGRAQALEHIWLGAPITAAKALACGLVNRVVPEAGLEEAADSLACALLGTAPLAAALAKRAVDRALDGGTLGEQLEYEAQLQSYLGRTTDHSEGVAAFLGKRAPVFKGE